MTKNLLSKMCVPLMAGVMSLGIINSANADHYDIESAKKNTTEWTKIMKDVSPNVLWEKDRPRGELYNPFTGRCSGYILTSFDDYLTRKKNVGSNIDLRCSHFNGESVIGGAISNAYFEGVDLSGSKFDLMMDNVYFAPSAQMRHVELRSERAFGVVIDSDNMYGLSIKDSYITGLALMKGIEYPNITDSVLVEPEINGRLDKLNLERTSFQNPTFSSNGHIRYGDIDDSEFIGITPFSDGTTPFHNGDNQFGNTNIQFKGLPIVDYDMLLMQGAKIKVR